ncbi:hypothetical protein JCM10908_005480 [Rhodotorula pacifica]|uniref:dolichyl-diphosphooligosaccharide--protein glycosyltransferase subunit 4 n=1 Tax=Rhodotorula pacifica TaxID=1495444 RepID=UPI003176A3B3
MPAIISDTLLTTLANTFGTLAVIGIVAYQFLEINAKRLREEQAAEEAARGIGASVEGSTGRQKSVRAVQ